MSSESDSSLPILGPITVIRVRARDLFRDGITYEADIPTAAEVVIPIVRTKQYRLAEVSSSEPCVYVNPFDKPEKCHEIPMPRGPLADRVADMYDSCRDARKLLPIAIARDSKIHITPTCANTQHFLFF